MTRDAAVRTKYSVVPPDESATGPTRQPALPDGGGGGGGMAQEVRQQLCRDWKTIDRAAPMQYHQAAPENHAREGALAGEETG